MTGRPNNPCSSSFSSEKFGLTIEHADPRELRAEGNEVFYGSTRIDVAYRDYETRDLIALEKELGKPLDGMRLLLKQNRMISSLTGDFDHKSCFEILTDPAIAGKSFRAGRLPAVRAPCPVDADRGRTPHHVAQPHDRRSA